MADLPSFDEVPEGSLGAADPRVYGQITIRGEGDPPESFLRQAEAEECPDCNVNVELVQQLELLESGEQHLRWGMVIAHDNGCPWLTAHGDD